MTRKGCDSGLFLLLGTGHQLAQQIWDEAALGHCELIMSTLTIHEVLVIHFRRGKAKEADKFRMLIYSSPWLRIVPVSARWLSVQQATDTDWDCQQLMQSFWQRRLKRVATKF